MLKVIEEHSRIKEAQVELKENLGKYSEITGRITIGGTGWHSRHAVSWSEKLGIWWTTYSLSNRYENAFGVEEPRWNTRYGHSIPSVIDVPFHGINRRIGGVFAVDENNKLYLLHRGRIGGGRKGIGKTLFLANYRGKWVAVQDGDSVSRLALVAILNSEKFPWQIANFVHELQRIKQEDIVGTKPSVTLTDTFEEEFSGTKEYVVGKVEAECDHGLVVSSLEKKLRTEGLIVGNRYPMDLYVLDADGEMVTLFEVKTDSSSASCYEAIGQLLFYSARLDRKPQIVAVFPHPFDREYGDVFDKIGIQRLTYTWKDNQPEFDNSQIANLRIK